MVKKLFYSMGEVAEMFDVNASLIRHWESKFDVLRPRKNKKGNRMFSPEDVENLKLIYHLVKERGMTLEGANRSLRRNKGLYARDAELLERLQHVRAMLLEVREELRTGEQATILADPTELAATPSAQSEPATVCAGRVAAQPVVPSSRGEAVAGSLPGQANRAEPNCAAIVSTTAPDEAVPAVSVPLPFGTPQKEGDSHAAASALPEREEDTGTQAVRRPRRRRDEEGGKELFAFYEQSLF